MSNSMGILPTFIAPRPRFELTNTPRIKVNQPRRLPFPAAVSTAPVNRCLGTNTVSSSTQRTRACSSNLKPGRRQPCRRVVYLGAPRCGRTGPYLLAPMFSFKDFGHSSGCSYSRTAKTSRTATGHTTAATSSSPRLPNPYAQLTKEVKQKLKQKVDIRSEANTPTQTGNGEANAPDSPTPGSGVTNIVSQGQTPSAVSGAADSSDDRSLTESGEICDDEEELYQEIRSNENTDEARFLFETYKALHQAQMEDICKRIQPRHLLRQLQNDGYFDYNYQGYTREPADGPIKKPNTKKPTERLLQLLSIY